MSTLLADGTEFSVSAWGAKFVVYGKAQPGGSKRGMLSKSTGRVIVLDDNPKASAWKEDVTRVAAILMKGRDPFAGPLYLRVTFYRERPASHFNKKGLKKSAPRYPTTRPDATKLLRPVEDAMSGIIYNDDNQICEQIVAKKFGTPERVEVAVGCLV